MIKPPVTMKYSCIRSTFSSSMQFITVEASIAEARVLAKCLWVISAAHPARCEASS